MNVICLQYKQKPVMIGLQIDWAGLTRRRLTL